MVEEKTGTKPRLKYLFQADFEDGTTYHQGLFDQSLYGGRNSYSDVLERSDEVIKFHLIADDFRATVDLQDGHFEINDTPIWFDQHFYPKKRLKLVYEQETRVEIKVQTKVDDELNPQIENMQQEDHYVNRVYIGWTDGKQTRGIWL